MKTKKKAAALIAAAALGAGVMTVSAFAEDTYKLYVNSDKASVGDTVTVSIIADTSEGIGGISFSVNYNPEELELQSDTLRVGDAISNWITGDEGGFNLAENGKIGLAYVTMGKGFSESNTEIMSASFKVLKPNSVITLSDVVVNADDTDSTDITDNGQVMGTTIECSHKNTETKTTPSTCVAKGNEDTVCKDCGETVATKELELAEHTWDEGVISKTPACTEDGEKTLTCLVCGETKTETVDAVGHKIGENTVTKEPTCTAEGQKASRCENCGEVFIEAIPATGHIFGEWEIDKEATCTEEGYKSHSCVNCTESETEPIPPTGHTFGEWIIVKEPTETESGIEERECSVCGKKGSREVATKETDVAPATTSGSSVDKPSADKDIANTGVASVAAVAGIAAIAAAAVVIAKKRK